MITPIAASRIKSAKAKKSVKLSLRNCGLTTLPEELLELPWLEELDLEEGFSRFQINNQITFLPSWLLDLKQLSRVNIKGCRLAGLIDIPGIVLDFDLFDKYKGRLSTKSIRGIKLKDVRLLTELFSIETLLELDLSNIQLSEVPDQIIQLSQLRYLNLSNNQLTEIPDQITRLSELRYLNLSSNQLVEIPNHITKLSQLQTLNLHGNQLVEIPNHITKLSQLQTLNLSKNQLSQFPEPITKLSQLQTLNLSTNQLGEIPEYLTQLSQLQALNLSSTQLSEIPEYITQLSQLQYLNLWENKISNVPDHITQLSELHHLNLNNNQLSEIPDQISQLSRLHYLNLSNNQLSEIPDCITQLSQLQTLYLSNNQLTEIPEHIAQLSQLKTFNLSNNQFREIPECITQLSRLQSLYLSKNQLREIPECITRLSQLQSLYLSNNQLEEIPGHITQLSQLQYLNLSNNRLSEISNNITKLSQLQYLNLSSNQLKEIPDHITRLSQLQYLYLSSNQLREISNNITQLTRLQSLYLSNNQLSEIPDHITQLSQLQSLNLSNNQLGEIPEYITQLSQLQYLYLSSNQLGEIPEYITQLSQLRSLNLSNNQLSEIPEYITQLSQLQYLDLFENDIIAPPIEVVKQGLQSIRNYFIELKTGGSYLYEAKLLVLGEGGAGKTSLCQKILDPAYELDSKEKSTEGIEIEQYVFELENGEKFRINLWDFGGQEIYHATHQFFLTKRSLYVLVTDSRAEDTDFNYWLNVVELLSDNSPLLIIQNEKQDRKKEINRGAIRGRFNNVKEFLPINLLTNRGVDKVLARIKSETCHLNHVGDKLPQVWVDIRNALESIEEDFISESGYLQICSDNGMKKRERALWLSNYLHDLGVLLHFQDNPILSRILILNNEWATNAVYKVLDNDYVNSKKGRFTFKDLPSIWDEDTYRGKELELITLMKKFRLAYEVGDTQGYIAPQLLPSNPPKYVWDANYNLQLKYAYEFMPKGILTRFIVETHDLIHQQRLVWKTGVILEHNGALAEVIEPFGKEEINIRVRGENSRELRTIVMLQLDRINKSYKQLEERVKKLVPCNCKACSNSNDPYFFKEEELRELLQFEKFRIECRKPPFQDVADVPRLVSDLFSKVDIQAHSALFDDYWERGKVLPQDFRFEGNIDTLEYLLERKDKKTHQKLDHLMTGQDEIKDNQTAILKAITASSNQILAKLSDTEQEAVRQIQSIIEEKATGQEETIKESLDLIDQAIVRLETKVPSAQEIIQEWKKVTAKLPTEGELKGKFKLVIPIIPSILKYEKELGWNLRGVFNKMMQEFKDGNVFFMD